MTSFVPTKGPKVAVPEATVEIISFGTPKGRFFMTAVPMLVPWAPPKLITPEKAPAANRRWATACAPAIMTSIHWPLLPVPTNWSMGIPPRQGHLFPRHVRNKRPGRGQHTSVHDQGLDAFGFDDPL